MKKAAISMIMALLLLSASSCPAKRNKSSLLDYANSDRG